MQSEVQLQLVQQCMQAALFWFAIMQNSYSINTYNNVMYRVVILYKAWQVTVLLYCYQSSGGLVLFSHSGFCHVFASSFLCNPAKNSSWRKEITPKEVFIWVKLTLILYVNSKVWSIRNILRSSHPINSHKVHGIFIHRSAAVTKRKLNMPFHFVTADKIWIQIAFLWPLKFKRRTLARSDPAFHFKQLDIKAFSSRQSENLPFM